MAIEHRRDFRSGGDFVNFGLFKRCFDVGALILGKAIWTHILRFHREQHLRRASDGLVAVHGGVSAKLGCGDGCVLKRRQRALGRDLASLRSNAPSA